MTEQMIKPEDVRIGDRIRIEYMVSDILRSETGTVAKIDKNGDFRSQEGWFIGPLYIKARIRKGEQIAITLLSRPTPPLPTEVGSVIHVSECRGRKCDTLAILDGEGLWFTPHALICGDFHEPQHITEWEPRNVVEVQE